LDDTKRGDQGFRSSNTTIDQAVKGQNAKTRKEIYEISGSAFGEFYRRVETAGILRWDEIDNEIQLGAVNIRTDLVLKHKKNHEDQELRDTVPREYHYLLNVFDKGEKTNVLPY